MDSSTAASYSGAYQVTVRDYYDYTPTFGLLIAAAAVFGLQTLALLAQTLRSRAYFLLWLVLFAASECGGYAAFAVFVRHVSTTSYLAELIILVLAPNLVTLVNYTVISRIVPHAGFDRRTSRLARYARWVPIVFVASDLICIAVQGIGGSQLAASNDNGQFDQAAFDAGKTLLIVGIAAQLGFQSLFALLAVYVYVCMPDAAMKRRLRWAWLCMLLTMALVTVRNIYRIIEFVASSGSGSAITSTEVPYFVLDTLMMALCAAVFIALDLGSEWVLPERIRRGQAAASAEQPEGKAEVQLSEVKVASETR